MQTTESTISKSLRNGNGIDSKKNVSVLEFVRLVQQMRHRQKRYDIFRRDEEGKKQLEKQVDEALTKVLDMQLEIDFFI